MRRISHLIVSALVGAALTLSTGHANAAVAGLSISVSGNHLVDANGNVVQLRGFNRSGTQYACEEGWGIFDGPVDDAAISSMVTWTHVNVVRVSLNEDCWLGINGVKAAYGGVNYQSAIAAFVQRLENHGLYVILDLHYAAPGKTLAKSENPMPDADHAPTFWSQVASAYKSDPAVIFDLFNEPYPDGNVDTNNAWLCLRDGSASGACSGFSYQAVGMQSLVNTVRATGATNVIMVGGPQYAGTLSNWASYAPVDSAGQLAASIHVYWNTVASPEWSPCYLSSCWDTYIAPVAASVPVVTGEFGQRNCNSDQYGPYLNWADAHGVSYLAWAWFVESSKKLASDIPCGSSEPSVIQNWSGTPTGEGASYHAHLAALP